MPSSIPLTAGVFSTLIRPASFHRKLSLPPGSRGLGYLSPSFQPATPGPFPGPRFTVSPPTAYAFDRQRIVVAEEDSFTAAIIVATLAIALPTTPGRCRTFRPRSLGVTS